MFLQVTSNSKPQISRKRGRPPGSKSSSRGGTPSPVVHNYSLRQRNPNQTFNGFDNRNPILDEESPDTFGKVVASLARQAKVFKGVSFKPSRKMIVVPNFCFLS